jgi:hypothetical protein
MMSTWKEMRRMSIKKKLKKVKTSRYLMGQDSELATHGVEVMEEESGPSKKMSLKITWSPKKRLQKSQQMIERRERLNTRVIEADSDVDDF